MSFAEAEVLCRENYARQLDTEDELADFRERFYIPPGTIYMDGNSLGLAIEHKEAVRINAALKKRGVIPDFRPPNIIRLAPAPLYVTFHDVWLLIQHLKAIIDNKEYESFPKQRDTVA